MGYRGFLDDVGTAVLMAAPDAYDSDDLGTTSVTTLNIEGYDGATFFLLHGTVGAGATAQVNILFSSTGAASDAAEITGATNAVFTLISTDTAAGVEIMDLNFTEAALGGKGIITATLTFVKNVDCALMAIPWGGTRTKRTAQTSTVLYRG